MIFTQRFGRTSGSFSRELKFTKHMPNNKNMSINFTPKKIFTGVDPVTLLEAFKIDHDFPSSFILTSIVKKPISFIKPKKKYKGEIVEYLCSVAELIRYRDARGDNDRDFWFFYKDGIVKVDTYEGETDLNLFLATDNKILTVGEFDDFVIDDNTSRVSILVKSSYGLETRSIKVDPIKVEDINLNYGPGFEKTHESVVVKLNKPASSIMFFHGPPGCGKSSYIKYLTSVVDKEFIFIPVAFAGELSSPDFMSLLLQHKDSVLILEDSEKVVQSRDQDDHNVSTVSTLLNISDGILGSMLNIKIVATYNGDKDKVDKALLRPGRLAIDHTFGKLDANTATKLAQKLGKNVTFDKEMSLAEIYNLGDETGYKEKQTRKIGFGV